MKEEEKSKYKFGIIMATIGVIISIICLLLEIFMLKTSPIFWIIILVCNVTILTGNIYCYKNSK